jgi:hypothetical protein
MFEFESKIFHCFIFIFVSYGESLLLVSWCVGGMCGMAGNDEDRARSRRPGAVTNDDHIGRILGSRMIERSGDDVCGLHCARENEEREFLG